MCSELKIKRYYRSSLKTAISQNSPVPNGLQHRASSETGVRLIKRELTKGRPDEGRFN